MHYFNYKNGELYAENISLRNIENVVKTPFYCYSASTFRRHVRVFLESFANRDVLVCYAMKANSNQAILTLIAKMGIGVDIVSGGEMIRAIKAGFSVDKIVYSGVAKTSAEIQKGLEFGIYCFNIESISEIKRINYIANKMGVKAPISVRVNPDIDAKGNEKIMTGKAENKFGILWKEIDKVYKLISSLKNLKIIGIDLHIGSQITNLVPFSKAFKRIKILIQRLLNDGHKIEHVDFGGGLGVVYNNNENVSLHLDEYAEMINGIIGDLKIKYIFEPGRMIAANAGVLVSKVEFIKEGNKHNFIISDVGMNDLIRPTLYDAYHDIKPIIEPTNNCKTCVVDVVGPVCESGDYIAKNRILPIFKQNDLFAIMSVGAYGAVQSSTYNTRPLIPEVLVDGDNFAIIRKRQEIEKIISMDVVPSWI